MTMIENERPAHAGPNWTKVSLCICHDFDSENKPEYKLLMPYQSVLLGYYGVRAPVAQAWGPNREAAFLALGQKLRKFGIRGHPIIESLSDEDKDLLGLFRPPRRAKVILRRGWSFPGHRKVAVIDPVTGKRQGLWYIKLRTTGRRGGFIEGVRGEPYELGLADFIDLCLEREEEPNFSPYACEEN